MSDKLFFIDKDAIAQLAEILKQTDLNEIEYEVDDRRVRLVRHNPQVVANVMSAPVAAAPVAASVPVAAAPSTPAANDYHNHPGLVRSPMVGTVYMAPEPGAASFVKVGDQVSAGQTLVIIEAMKVMNPIKAQKAGKVTQVIINDAMPVEYGEPLLVIE